MPVDKRSTRVLFVGRSAWSEHGGIQRFNRRVASALRAVTPSSTVYMLRDRRADLPESDERQLVRGFGAGALPFLAAFMKVSLRSDVLMLGHVNLAPLCIPYKVFRPGGRVVLFAHGIEVWGDARYRKVRLYEPWLLRMFVHKIAVVSRFSLEMMCRAFSLDREKTVVFPNAFDVPEVSPKRSHKSSNILAVSRLGLAEREKNIDKLIQALPAVIKVVPSVTLTIVGDGELILELKGLAEKLGVTDRVNFAGFVKESELRAAYRDAAVFALPSSKEGFGIVYLEAWREGLPVVASCFGAAPEVVTNGSDGYTVDPDDVERLSRCLSELLLNKGLAEKFAAQGLRKAREIYSHEAFASRLSCLIASTSEGNTACHPVVL